VNPYSIGIIGAFILIFCVVFSIGAMKDLHDHKSLFYMRLPNYDYGQYYLIKFRKENFREKIRFCSLFCYLVKVNFNLL